MLDAAFEKPIQCPPNFKEKLGLFEKWLGTRSKEFWKHFNQWGSEDSPENGETYLWLIAHWNQ